MGKMPLFSGYRIRSESDLLVDMIQKQEMKLARVRRDDHWDVTVRRMGSRRKYLGTWDLIQADKEKLKVYFLHLIEKEMETI